MLYKEFVKKMMTERPAGTKPKDYMKIIAQKWKSHKTGKGAQNEEVMEDDGVDLEGGAIKFKCKVTCRSDDKHSLKTIKRRSSKHKAPVLLPPYEKSCDDK